MIDNTKKVLEGLTFIDLFAGLGGFHIALESLGAKCVYANEWDLHAQEVYKANFNMQPEGDITKVDEKAIPDHDILCAGFPCQAFSISGKRLGFQDSRGTLFFDVARIVKEKRPKVVFMENVKNFASHDGGKTMAVVKATMEELGYTFDYKVLNAVDYGVPQKRERVYMVCFRNDIDSSEFSFPKPFKLMKHVEDFLLDDEEMVKHLYVQREDTYYNDTIDDKYSDKAIRLGVVNKGGQGERIYSTKGIAITFSAYGGGVFAKTGGYLVNGRPRRLHPRECARLMGYPDHYIISPKASQAYKQFGNSVVVDVIQLVAQNIGHILGSIMKKRQSMKLYTNQDQTAKLIELGFPNPQYALPIRQEGQALIHALRYTIGELIEFLPKTIKWKEVVYSRVIDVECVAYYSWDYEVYFGSDLIFEEKELIDSLFKACVTLKEGGVI